VAKGGLFSSPFVFLLERIWNMKMLETLNNQFAISDQLHLQSNESGFVMIMIDNEYAKAQISMYGGQVLSFLPHGETKDLLFLSDKAVYQDGKAIRGGIPVCWPWFGDDLSGLGMPSHGFARNQPWKMVESKALIDGGTSVTLLLSDTDESRAVWPYQFELYLEVVVGRNLTINLTTKNTGDKTLDFTQALHTYFNISSVDNVKVLGLINKYYLDKLDQFSLKMQQGNVLIDKELDRIYQSAPPIVELIDSNFNRTVQISSTGTHTTVVWNPWDKAITDIKDLDKTSYRKFVCIETVNAADDNVILEADKEYTLSATYGMPN